MKEPKCISLQLDYDKDLEQFLFHNYPDMQDYKVVKRSLDPRGAPRGRKPKYNYQIELLFENVSKDENFHLPHFGPMKETPIIVGAGPAGLFAALYFADHGISSIVIERGDPIQQRIKKIAKFWKDGILDVDSNVCYGEGGAGLFSDGKLYTRVKSPLIKYFRKRLVDFGAPEFTLWDNEPHIGSNKLRRIINTITKYLEDCGTKFLFNTKLVDIDFDNHSNTVKSIYLSNGQKMDTRYLLLATGHSATDIYYMLGNKNVTMQCKNFAIGFRIEHRRDLIDHSQFGPFAGDELLGAAKYRLKTKINEQQSVFSFCMCPGGYILSSGTDVDGLVTNGMSNFKHNSKWSNSAIITNVLIGREFGAKWDEGLKFQRLIEYKAWHLSKEYNGLGKILPGLHIHDLLKTGRPTRRLPPNSVLGNCIAAPIQEIFPFSIFEVLLLAIDRFAGKIKGFNNHDALVVAPETRTSSPVTIVRDRKTLESISNPGLYPLGEGAGYAGGITSAAVDGMTAAERIISLEFLQKMT
ncbi:MAG: NAD(P)/FAD-dependent oxidoreductase [bacterium]